ncbi:hypothetical protein QJS10_CPA05g01495 [Acorus calamus]|uniref:Uncharacterized protein n=1 Tax=Acorus calamus TaxID=4465 RepID=A0AAV9EWH6_ACOCL|nr:hypothetical protein QJS10_CPA05g01495 [Acorus calamus]
MDPLPSSDPPRIEEDLPMCRLCIRSPTPRTSGRSPRDKFCTEGLCIFAESAEWSGRKKQSGQNEGGLGLKRIGEWNEAAMGTRLWEITNNHQSLWASWMKARESIQYLIFEGHSINIWDDPWLNGHGLRHYFNGQALLLWGPPNATTVATLIRNGKWEKPNR